MARFLGTPSGRTLGFAGAAEGFTKAEVFSSPGTTTFAVPTDVNKLKVFVIGAGSCYRPGLYCFNSDNCDSGVSFPKSCYCACFCGHLTGAGGGYAEKTFIQKNDSIAGKTLTINVGSIDGLSASSVSGDGIGPITATNATEVQYNWSCTDNSTARDASNDNPIAFGFKLPICGYQNNFSGYYNYGGTGTGGDINRNGGRGVLIPQFLYDGYLDGVMCSSGSGGNIVNTSSCWINPNVNCSCLKGYHTTFGSNCCSSSWRYATCVCYNLCANISNLCAASGLALNLNSRYAFAGLNDTKTCCSISAENATNGLGSVSPLGFDNNESSIVYETPIGVGGNSGNSSDDGKSGASEQMILSSTYNTSKSTSGGSSCDRTVVQYSHYSSGYDYTFGGTQRSCYCANYCPGCYSNCSSFQGTGYDDTSFCYQCMGTTWTYVFGSNFSGVAHCFCMPYGLSQNTQTTETDCRTKCLNIGFSSITSSQSSDYVIPLSSLVSSTDTNVSDISYGAGAYSAEPAKYGGGGNRLNPIGGQGLVVIVY